MKYKPFVISTGSFNLGIGGIKVLHKLCDLLNKHNFEAYIVGTENSGTKISDYQNFYVYAEYETPIAPQNLLANKNDFITIYPEDYEWHFDDIDWDEAIEKFVTNYF